MTAIRMDRGGATVELVLLAPALMIVLLFIVFAARMGQANLDVSQAAAAAARAASLTQTSGAAASAARFEAEANLQAAGVECVSQSVDVSASMAPGSRVSVTVSCPISLSDLGGIGLPGARTVTGRALEPIDTYRGYGRGFTDSDGSTAANSSVGGGD